MTTEEKINSITNTLAALTPLAGAVIGIGKLVVALAKKQGVTIGTTEEEIGRLEAVQARIAAADAAWRAEHPETPEQ